MEKNIRLSPWIAQKSESDLPEKCAKNGKFCLCLKFAQAWSPKICPKCHLGHKSQPKNGRENHQNLQKVCSLRNRQANVMEKCKQKSPKHAKICPPQNRLSLEKSALKGNSPNMERRKWFVKMKWGGDSLYSQFHFPPRLADLVLKGRKNQN